jgi:hypothetical protein
MHAVVVERETDHDRIHAQHALEVADDRDRAALAHREGLLAPFVGKRGTGLGKRRIVEWQLGGRRAGKALELDLCIGRKTRTHESVEGGADFLRVLRADQAEGHLRRGLPRYDCLCALPSIAADETVDLRGWAGSDLLDQHAVVLARRYFEADFGEKILRS